MTTSVLASDKEELHEKTFDGEKKMEETSGRATEEGSLSQDGQTCNRVEQTSIIKFQYKQST